MIGLGLSITQLAVRQLVGQFNPLKLFALGEQGAWYDPSDLSTLFQDAAGTTPVTSVEQPVGLMLDKSGRGNHASQTTATSRPVLSARYNLLTKTEQFDDAVWTKANVTATANKLSETSASGTHSAAQTLTVSAGVQMIASVVVQAAERSFVGLYAGNPGQGTIFNLNTGARHGDLVSAPTAWSINSIGGGLFLCSITYTTASTATAPSVYICNDSGAFSYVGETGKGIFVSKMSLVPANQADLPYQRVNTATDYQTIGFPSGEVFDGVDDSQIAATGGGSTTKFFWCGAIQCKKIGQAQTLFSDTGTNTGYRVRINASNQLELSAGNGTAFTTVATAGTLAIGQRAVLTAWHDGTNLKVQIDNGTVATAAFVTATAGTAQFTMGKDNNAASSFFGGWLYEKVYLKDDVPSDAEIISTKQYMARSVGLTI